MSPFSESIPDEQPGLGDAYRARVLAALRGAARRGWLGPAAAAVEREASAGHEAGRLAELDSLALSIKSALERVALPLGKAAHAFVERKAWSVFGYGGIEDYARERLDRTGRWLRDQASLGRALEGLPGLARALDGADGGRPLGKVSARLVSRVATAESLAGWIALARRVPVRELKQLVRDALRAGSAIAPVGEGVEAEGAHGEGDARRDIRQSATVLPEMPRTSRVSSMPARRPRPTRGCVWRCRYRLRSTRPSTRRSGCTVAFPVWNRR
jgi:hypothetical protein